MISPKLAPALAAGLLLACGGSSTGKGGSGGSGGSGGTGPKVEICGNIIDDDGNGLADCADPACFTDSHCPVCGDGYRNDSEPCDASDPTNPLGTHSCAEQGFNAGGILKCNSSCKLDTGACVSHEDCSTPGDEDHNGLADCADPACAALPTCMQLSVTQMPGQTDVGTQATMAFKVADGQGKGLSGYSVVVTAPAGAAAPPGVQTGSDGVSSITVRLGRKAGTQTFNAAVSGTELTAKVDVTAVDPPAGNIITVVDVDRQTGEDETGPASAAHIGAPIDVQVASDSTLYVAEACRVLKVSPEGVLSVAAGSGICGSPPDTSSPAVGTNIGVTAIALDDAGGILYIADQDGGRLRALDLNAGTIKTVAGGGTKTGATVENAAPTDVLLTPNAVTLGPDHALYVSDAAMNRVLRIDLTAQAVTTFEGTAMSADKQCREPLQVVSCTPACRTLFDGQNKPFVLANQCGQTVGGGNRSVTAAPGVVRIDAGDSLVSVGGRLRSLLVDDQPATLLTFEGSLRGGFDAAGNILAVSSHRLLRIDGNTGRYVGLGGTSTPGFAGEDAPIATAGFTEPGALVIAPNGDLYIADTGDAAVRRVVGVGESTPRPISVLIGDGDQQTGNVAQYLPTALTFTIKDAAGKAIPKQPVTIVPPDPGTTIYAGADTDATGLATRNVRLGYIPGNAQEYLAGIIDIHGNMAARPGKFHESAFAAPAASIFVASGEDTTGSTLFDPRRAIPAASAHVAGLIAVGADPDGTIYLAEPTQLIHISAQGALTRFAGDGSYTGMHKGDGGPAIAAEFNMTRVAPDHAHGKVYLIDHDVKSLVRAVDVTTGNIATVAGGGADTSGNSVKGTTADVADAVGLGVDKDGKVYVASNGPGQGLHVFDPSTGNIHNVLTEGSCGPDDGLRTASSLAVHGTTVYVSGQICHLGVAVSGVLSWEADGTVKYLPGTFDSVGLTVSTDGQVLMGHLAGDPSQTSNVDEIDPGTLAMTQIAGYGFKGSDYVPAVQYSIQQLRDIAQGEHLWLVTSKVALVIW